MITTPYYDEEVRLDQGADTGENDNVSIQPVNDDERLWAPVLQRTSEHLRKRIEELKKHIKELKFESDYNHGVVLQSWDSSNNKRGKFTATLTSGKMAINLEDANLEIIPILSPGFLSGGRLVTLLDGTELNLRGARLTLLALDGSSTQLWIFADPGSTGQRGYANGQDMGDTANVYSIGANDISFELFPDISIGTGADYKIYPVEGMPTRHIKVGYKAGITLQDLMYAINNDHTSQGAMTWGIAEMIKVNSNEVHPSMIIITDQLRCSATTLQGGYDSEVHTVLSGCFAAFFSGPWGPLADGEGLALKYPAGPVEDLGIGGRRQSIKDFTQSRMGLSPNDNTGTFIFGEGLLFNTGTQPQFIPGSIPIGKRMGNYFIFIDGTIICADGRSYSLGDSAFSLDHFAESDGASLIGYNGSGLFNADGGATTIPAGTVENAIDTVPALLKLETTGNSGARLIGIEGVTGVGTDNNACSLDPSSIRVAFNKILNTLGNETTPGGVNARVSEWGHNLHGPLPLAKDMNLDLGSPVVRGGIFLKSIVLQNDDNFTDGGDIQHSLLQLRHLVGPLNNTGAVIYEFERVTRDGSSSAYRLRLLGTNIAAHFIDIRAAISSSLRRTYNGADLSRSITIVKLSNTGALNYDGYYQIREFALAGSNPEIGLNTLDGSYASFGGSALDWASATITFYDTLSIGTGIADELIAINHSSFGPVMTIYNNLAIDNSVIEMWG
jgi:hypothetical protein